MSQLVFIRFGTSLPLNLVLFLIYSLVVNDTPPAGLLKGDMFLGVLGKTIFLYCTLGSIQRNSGQVPSMRGNPKGDRRPPLCRRGGGVHRGGTPSKGSRPYAVFWLLFVRTKSNPGCGGGTPTGQRDGARHHKSRKSLTTPSRSRRTFSSSSTVSRRVWILPI